VAATLPLAISLLLALLPLSASVEGEAGEFFWLPETTFVELLASLSIGVNSSKASLPPARFRPLYRK